ncbi:MULTISPECIES: nickel pincer cofactor biosynthesis protein LarB [Thermoanaerobacterium]|uniref:NCAIR mutase (PurE)-related protein n=1 Tax=Thermoanaerobacterium butyriciformans TaxID=1702242 RepID=A0ABS4NGH0_9THEO|nr:MULTISPECIES: nickel pincer cofactor biosynthesis protein LarB [Thermoanaerobacterium]MBP2072779.1 NCAIR mutase (PurE)-related protein [Thermoanaerobacterium butyriciformans]MDK2806056.1 pyridinium-3,5-biscarboxylic acid mononucleotide synthase [Thermoanaerobacterium sp.]WHE08477.1 nickel pincer cofactor biosynthesis protein LarB [Thermoanaerobacterium thermosaccharolyticum]WKV08664.1 nickel pincer cofactor biosynthesis protein LarB [Thermoanaerobacterium sp. CMT5567-10]
MYDNVIRDVLKKYENGYIGLNEAVDILKKLPYEDLGFAKIDYNREVRRGFPEVIYCEGKTPEQVKEIALRMYERGSNVLGTRASIEHFEALKEVCDKAVYYDVARIISIKSEEIMPTKGVIGVVAAGTSDLPVAEEAAVTAELMGNSVKRIYDVGVAGIHRLMSKVEELRKFRVIICIAGMEGALPTVVGGLVACPIIAVPTSVGYGANFHGLSALLAMLNSCSSGVSVVNIDNGFGAAYSASLINKIGE